MAVACGALGLGQSPVARAQDRPLSLLEPTWRSAYSWRQAQGLPQDTVMTLVQTRDGYIWLGTKGGLVRFDGVRFTMFEEHQQGRLHEDEVWTLLEDRDGGLWVGTYGGGVSRLLDGRFTTYTTKEGLPTNFVRALCLDKSGSVWIGTDGGLSRFHDGRLIRYTAGDGLASDSVLALFGEKDGSVLVGTERGLQRIRDGHVDPMVLLGIRGPVSSILRDREGALWVASQEGLLRSTPRGTRRYTRADGLSSDRIRSIQEDPRGRLWVASEAGLDRFVGGAGGSLPFHTEVAGILTSMLVDREDGLWAGYRVDGLALFHRGPFTTVLPRPDDLPNAYISSVLQDGRDTVWMGTMRGLAAVGKEGLTTYGPAHGLPNAIVTALAEDREGYLLVGTDKGLVRSREPVGRGRPRGQPRFAAVSLGPSSASGVRVIHQDPRGVIWVGTSRDGLVRLEAGQVTTFTTKEGLAHNAVRAIADDGEGGLWIGTRGGGLNRLVGMQLSLYAAANGLPSPNIQGLYRDADNTLWILTRQALVRFKQGQFTPITVADGLYSNYVYAMVEHNGDFWFSCSQAIFQVNKKQLNDFADGKVAAITSKAYGREHGLHSAVGTVGHHPLACKTRDGRLWFSTAVGSAVLDPRLLSDNRVAPPVHVEEVRIDGQLFDPRRLAEAAAGRGDLVLRYTALSFAAPDKVAFKYKLEGFDHDWIEAGGRRVAFYTNMPPGSYRFRVIASNNDGVWNETGASVELRLAPHFHQTYWFYGLCALALALAGAATQRIRVARLQARERELSSRVEEAMARIKVLNGLLPICSSCKKIRDDTGYWSQMEAYIHEHSEAQFSHGMCPECMGEFFPKYAKAGTGKKA